MSEAHEERVAGRVPERVVELLEAVEVEEPEQVRRRARLPIRGEEDRQVADKRAPVGEPGERVGQRLHLARREQALVLAGEPFGARVCGDRPEEEQRERAEQQAIAAIEPLVTLVWASAARAA